MLKKMDNHNLLILISLKKRKKIQSIKKESNKKLKRKKKYWKKNINKIFMKLKNNLLMINKTKVVLLKVKRVLKKIISLDT